MAAVPPIMEPTISFSLRARACVGSGKRGGGRGG
jgi:hypothetical protein